MSCEEIFNTQVLLPITCPSDSQAVDQGLMANLPVSACALNSYRLNRRYFKDGTLFFRCSQLDADSGFIFMAFNRKGQDLVEIVSFCPEDELPVWRYVIESGLNWSLDLPRIVFHCCPLPMEQVVVEVSKKKMQTVLPFGKPNAILLCSSLTELKLEENQPLGVNLSVLKMEDLEKVYRNLPYRSGSPPEILSEVINLGLGVGPRLAESGELVCWSLLKRIGTHGALGTDSNHLRKGYAKCVVREITRRSFENDLIPVVEIAEENGVSMNLYISLGYKRIGYTTRFCIK